MLPEEHWDPGREAASPPFGPRALARRTLRVCTRGRDGWPAAPFGCARDTLRVRKQGRDGWPDAPFGCARDTLRVRKQGRDGLRRTAQRPGVLAGGAVEVSAPMGSRSSPVGQWKAQYLRSACTVPHAVPVSFREAHVGRCPAVLPGPRTKSRWVCGSIPAEGPRRGKRSGGGCSGLLRGTLGGVGTRNASDLDSLCLPVVDISRRQLNLTCRPTFQVERIKGTGDGTLPTTHALSIVDDGHVVWD
jgi:hypothetical protein